MNLDSFDFRNIFIDNDGYISFIFLANWRKNITISQSANDKPKRWMALVTFVFSTIFIFNESCWKE